MSGVEDVHVVEEDVVEEEEEEYYCTQDVVGHLPKYQACKLHNFDENGLIDPKFILLLAGLKKYLFLCKLGQNFPPAVWTGFPYRYISLFFSSKSQNFPARSFPFMPFFFQA